MSLVNGDIHLRYSLSEGSGLPTVVFLHGFLGCRQDWDEVVDLLGDNYRFLRVDLPGHGSPFGDLPPEAYAMPGCARLIINLLDKCEIETCHPVGYSMGGRLGLYLLTHHPDRFRSAVIESATAGLRTESERTARLLQEKQWIIRLREQPYDEFLHDWYAQPIFKMIDRSSERFSRMMERRQQHDQSDLALVIEQMGTGVMPSLWDKLPDINVPVLFTAGEKDEKYCDLAEKMANLCPRGKTAIIAGAGHNTHFERPEAFAEKVSQFLKQNV